MTGYATPAVPTLRERADHPLVRGAVPAGAAPVVAVAAGPPHPSNAVVLLTRRGGAPAQPVRAIAEAVPSGEQEQWFSGSLPAVEEGRSVDYRAELIRGGQLLASLPADGTWLTVTGTPAPAAAPDPGPAAPVSRSACAVEFFATFSAVGRLEVIGETPEGFRINFAVESGSVVGPDVDGVVGPGGGDWMCIRRDGVADLDIRATFRTADGAVVFYQAQGLLDLGPDGYAQAVAGQLRGTPPFTAAPTFATADARWRWLNRLQGFGIGRATMDDARVDYEVYLPRAGDWPHDH